MPKDREEILKELKDTYNEGKEKKAIISKSNDLLSNLFAEGVKVKNVKGEGEIEFKNCDDAKGFLNDLKRSGDYPLEEAGREKAYEQHIYFYLYSKGIKPDELAEFMIDPESEAGKKVQDKVKETRQEYFDMIVEKDIKKIGKMYIDGFKNLEDYDVNWLKDVTDAKKINDHLQDFTVLSGVQTYLIQTNRQAAEMRPIDVEVTKEIGEQAANAGININEISSGLSLIQTEAQDIETVFSRRNATDSDGELIRYSAICQMNKTLPDGDITIKNLNVSDFKKEHISGEILSSYVAGLSYLSEDDLPEEYRHDIVAFLNGEKDAVPPYHVFEVEGGEDWPLKLGSYIKRGAIKGDAEIVDYEYVVDPKKWKESVEFDFDNSILMNPANVIRCTEYAKKGELSKLTGNKDEDKNFLEALDGNLENWDKLSKVSQAAVSSSLALKKPELFIGNADEMYEKAKNASIDIDNPAYLKAAEGMKFFSRKGFAANLDSVMDKLSRDKLEKSLDSMEIDKKKEIAKALFVMQLGDAEFKDINKKPEDMIDLLAQGAEIKVKLSHLSGNEKKEIKELYGDGTKDLGSGIKQEVKFKGDTLTINVKVSENTGEEKDKVKVEADIRGFSPDSLKTLMKAFDDKMNELDSKEIDGVIKELGGGNLEKGKMASFVKDLGKGKEYEAKLSLEAKSIDPPSALTEDDYMAVNKIWGSNLDKSEKYPQQKEISVKGLERIIKHTSDKGEKELNDYYSKFLKSFKEQEKVMNAYAEAAEKMHILREENEKSDSPSDNLRNFARIKESELSGMYLNVRESYDKMKIFVEKVNEVPEKQQLRYADYKMDYVENQTGDRKIINSIEKYTENVGDTFAKLGDSLAANFEGIDFEKAASLKGDEIVSNKWKFMGISFKNSDQYQKIADSVENVKEMRQKNLSADSVKEYKDELNHLRDLCEDYIVSHKHPRSGSGKDRLKMIKDIWEGISNIDEKLLDKSLENVKQDKKIKEVNIHSGRRKKISFKELLDKEPERKERIRKESEKRKQIVKDKTEKLEHGKNDVMTNNRALKKK